MHAFNIKTLAGIMGTKGFDSNKTSIMELIVKKALQLRNKNQEETNILELVTELSNVRLCS